MFNFTRRLGFWVSIIVLAVFAYAFSTPAAQQQVSGEGSVEGFVATILAPQFEAQAAARRSLISPQGVSFGQPILLPDIKVIAKKDGRDEVGSAAITNPKGFFVITGLPEGTYQICVSGTGYKSSCDDRRINVKRWPALVGHPVLIQPSANAIAGTVWMADRTTPCFWFRQAISPQALQAKVSLVDSNQQVVAGPVSGNDIGQYVLPTSVGSGSGSVHAVCDTGISDAPVRMQSGAVLQDVAMNNHTPQIVAMDFTKGGVGVRRVNPGETVQVAVQATDLDGDALHYSWADDSGRNLGLPDSPTVDWAVLNSPTLNTLHVQVSDGRGGVSTLARSLPSGTNEILFAGQVFNRQTLGPVPNAVVSLNKVNAKTDKNGRFRVSAADAGQFVLNVTKPGFALASLILRTRATNISVPLDAVQTSTINAGTGGTVQVSPAGCDCQCTEPRRAAHHGDRDDDRDRDRDRDRDDHDKNRDRDKDRDRDDHDRDDHGGHKGKGNGCGQTAGGGVLSLKFPAGALVDATGAAYTGTTTVEGLQYDLSQQNPIPGDFGAVYQGKPVRLASFGSFHVLPRDAKGNALKMASGKTVGVSLPILTAQQSLAPATIPFFHYDEVSGSWLEDGTLTRQGNVYVGSIAHFSAFNADTVFPGGACVKVVLDNSFVFPVTLAATYYDPTAGTFHHNGTQSNDLIIGVERMTPFQNFTLKITDSSTPTAAVVSVPLNSGPGLNTALFPAGLDTDQVNFSHCNGPVQISNNTLPATEPYFLGEINGGTITDNSLAYQKVTDAQAGGSRDTLVHWKTANGFLPTPTGEATAIYFNNGDLKFGRDMHCRVTNTGTNALACYVSNFGNVGTDDAITAVTAAEAYEASGKVTPQPVATVTMEYDPVKGVQFWAYHGEVITGGVSDGGKYFPNPTLDSQGNKTMPDICMGCHYGSYSGSTTTGVVGAAFLPFDLDSFKDDTNQLFPANPPSAAVQTQLHTLNNMIANTAPPAAITELINQLWYSSTTATVPFTFNQGAAQLPGTPFVDGSGHHYEPLYDNVVKQVCRTCHVANPLPWNTYSLMQGAAGDIQFHACAPEKNMPNAEVPWKVYWQENKSSTLASELNFSGAGCPNH